jgi:hypothetical protein
LQKAFNEEDANLNKGWFELNSPAGYWTAIAPKKDHIMMKKAAT